jgi:hypothetical protein
MTGGGTGLDDRGADSRRQYGLEAWLFFEAYEIIEMQDNLGEVSKLH